MGASFSKVMTVAGTVDSTFSAAQQALIQMGAILKDRKLDKNELGILIAKTNVRPLYSGEEIVIRISSTASLSCNVEVSSRMKIQLVGWGRNKTNVEDFERQLAFVLEDRKANN
jgi:hypothetical protein